MKASEAGRVLSVTVREKSYAPRPRLSHSFFGAGSSGSHRAPSEAGRRHDVLQCRASGQGRLRAPEVVDREAETAVTNPLELSEGQGDQRVGIRAFRRGLGR